MAERSRAAWLTLVEQQLQGFQAAPADRERRLQLAEEHGRAEAERTRAALKQELLEHNPPRVPRTDDDRRAELARLLEEQRAERGEAH